MRKLSHLLSGFCLLASVSQTPAWSQQPPPQTAQTPAPEPPEDPAPQPPPADGRRPFASRGTIRTWNYGPDGNINGFVLDRNILVMVPPEVGANLSNIAKPGSRVNVAGSGRNGVNVQTVIEPQTLEINGQTLTVAAAGPPPAPGGPRPGRARRGPSPPAAGPDTPAAPPPPATRP